MKYRSWLMVPGSNDRLLTNCVGSGADVVIVDLEDSVPAELKRLARGNAVEWLSAHRANVLEGRPMGRWVRINSMSTSLWREDILAVIPNRPDGILLPKADGPETVRQLAAELYEIEARCGVPANSTRIIPIVGESPQSALRIPEYLASGHQRIAGLSWGAHDLAASISGTSRFETGIGWSDVFKFVRAQTLLAAHATGVMAIDMSYSDYANRNGLAQAALASRSDGFTGMLAIHPDQVETINQAFMPSQAEIQEARDIVDAFEANPGTEMPEFNGRMIDKPRLKLARRMLGIVSDEALHAVNHKAAILRPA